MQLLSFITNLSRSQPLFISWLRDHLLPCPFKYLTGLDCPGCGFQRSVLALLQGNISESFSLYPATIPLVVFFMYGIADRFFRLDNESALLKKILYIIVGGIVFVGYGFKLWHIYAHVKSLAPASAAI